ncbi:unnamed protein product [Macrosiphum euphorbiae]|uniref:Proteasome assembly chaperone 3 n=1 Tax=Macrosiphum euphorbiae TaxID=13131 RepID=A0AAV0VNH7_9HEMI|nr:unnamed protein product [Macrosiphum euphorbiae]
MEIPEKNIDIATIEYVKPKTKMFSFTSEVLGVTLYNQILCYDNCFFVVINQDNTFSCLSVAMSQRNSMDTISSAIFSTDPDSRSESIANTLTKSLKTSIPIYVSFNANIETIGLKDVISSLINFFKSHSEIGIC